MAILDVPHHTPPISHAADDDHHGCRHQRRHGKYHGGGDQQEAAADEDVLNKGVRHLCERAGSGGVTSLPPRYVLPPSQRPAPAGGGFSTCRLPVVDLARLRAGDRAAALGELDSACREYGFFQVVNHGVDVDAVLDVARRFFDLPFAARAPYMSSDIRAPVRYGTSFNQLKDGVLCWRDFLKLVCDGVVGSWPGDPADLREVVSAYARATQRLFRELMEAALDALLGNTTAASAPTKAAMLAGCAAGSQMLIANCFPACPEPELTLGMPPHSDYGLLTVLLPDQVRGLEVRHVAGRWLLVDPLPGALLVNVGDHLEIFSNGRYRSVLHRVRVNAERPRISVASLHSLPPETVVAPAPELVDGGENPRRYMDTDFAAFLSYIAAAEGSHKSFLDSRRIPHPSTVTE